MAILQGSEVAYVERAPAAFLGFEARKEGRHLRSCKPGICLAFCFAAHTATAPRCHPETIPRAQKQKIGSGCNFFSIADCRVTKKRRSWPKNAVKKLQNGPFSLCGNGRESLIEKSCRNVRIFVFAMGSDCRNVANLAKNTRSRQRWQRQWFRPRSKPRSDG